MCECGILKFLLSMAMRPLVELCGVSFVTREGMHFYNHIMHVILLTSLAFHN